MPAPIPNRRRASFQPRITLALVYFALFFFAFCLLFALPALFEIARSVAPGPEQQEAALEATRALIRPKLPVAVALALVATGLGIYTGRLPGTRPR